MTVLDIILTSIGSILTLFILTKIMGHRQVSQLSMFDYINGITIGSIAAEMATGLDGEWFKPLTAMVVYALSATCLSFLSDKSYRFRRLLSGRPIVLLHKGELYKENFQEARLDLEEFLTQCRIQGFFDISQLESAILETNGHISFLPLSKYRPMNPDDCNLTPAPDTLVSNLIIDGNLMKDNLKKTGNDEKWLSNQLNANNVSNVSEVFLAICDNENQITVYPKKIKEKAPSFYE